MRVLLAILLIIATPDLAAARFKLKLPTLKKNEEKICDRKTDGIYCGKGLKKRTLFRCVGGAVETAFVCDFGCDQRGQTCVHRPPRPEPASR